MIPLCVPEIKGNEWRYIKQCLDTNWVSSAGSFVELFERKFKEYVGSNEAIATINGTSAIHLALNVLGIGPGDEVIVPSMTFIASVNPIKYVGAEPVFVDVCRGNYTMDVNKIERLITDKTKAILPVHLYGNVVDMEPLMKLANKYGLYVIEDATEGLGSKYRFDNNICSMVGSIGDIGCFSFNGNKLITTGAGGMLVTNNKKVANKAKSLSTQAKIIEENNIFLHDDIGYNFRMPNILAAMGVAQLENINNYIEIKKNNNQIYNKLLSNIEGITLISNDDNVCQWLFSLLIEDDFYKTRDKLVLQLKKVGIESRPFFKPIHNMKPYKNCKCGKLKVSQEISLKGLSLPSSIGLTSKQIERICEVIIKK